MGKFLAFILLVLAAVSLAPIAVVTPYIGTDFAPYAPVVYAALPKAMAGVAGLLFLVLLAARPHSVHAESQGIAPSSDSDVINFIAILQEKGRLVDFLMDDVTAYSDAQVGAAARVLHGGCKAALVEHFGIRNVRDESEGTKITVPTEYAADEYRLVGKISGEAPFSGTLIHHGWKAEWVKLPRLLKADDQRLPTIAPAEVELG